MTFYGAEKTKDGIMIIEDMGSRSLFNSLKKKPEIIIPEKIQEQIDKLRRSGLEVPIRLHSEIIDKITTIKEISYGDVKVQEE